MPRFLHTADWQLGRQYSRFSDDGAILADARFTTIERLAQLATDQQVDAILVAGDVFDAQTVSDRTLHRGFQAMAAFPGPWVVIPGNHDAALAESVWTRAQRIGAVPAHAHILLQAQPQAFPALGFTVLPAPLTQRQTFADTTAWFDTAQTDPTLLRIGLAHGSLQGALPEAADAGNPIAPDRARTARLDYLALGDWHGLKRVDARTWYSGTPEPDRFKGNEPGHVLLVDIHGPGAEPEVTAHRVGQHAWFQQDITLSVPSDVDAFVQRLQDLPPRSVLDLTLRGQLDLATHQRLEQALGAAAGRHQSLICHTEALRLSPTAEDLATLQADGYLADVIDTLRTLQEGAQAERAREALVILADLLRQQAPGAQDTRTAAP